MCFSLFLSIILILNSKIYSFEDENIELFEYSEIEKTLETVSSVSNLPDTNSKHIIAIDRESKRILYEKDAFSKTPMASTTKILTAIIAIEECNLDEEVSISSNASKVSGSTLGISNGTKIPMKDLLYGLMLCSGNDCAVAIAEHIGENVDSFSSIMNNKAKELSLENSNYTSPHGLDDDNHYLTSYDLAILSDYALRNNTFKKIVGTKETVVNIRQRS